MDEMLLSRLVVAFERIADQLAPKGDFVGFRQPSYPATIDVRYDAVTDSCWQEWRGKDNPKVPLPAELVGEIKGVEVVTKSLERFGDVDKLVLHVQADRWYRITSGLLTQSNSHHYNNFTGALLESLSAATDDQLKKVLTLRARKGSTTDAVFADLYDGGSRINRVKGEPIPGEHAQIIDRVNAVLGFTPGRQSQVAEEDTQQPQQTQPIDRDRVLDEIGKHCKALGWSSQEAVNWLQGNFSKQKRADLSDQEAAIALADLQTKVARMTQPSPKMPF